MAELLNALIAKPDLANAVGAIASAIVALLAFIVSAISLYVAHTTLKHQRNHNVLSVRPLPMIAVGSSGGLTLVELTGDDSSSVFLNAHNKVRAALSNLRIDIEYTDVYGSTFAPYQKDLTWFGRSTSYPDAKKNAQGKPNL